MKPERALPNAEKAFNSEVFGLVLVRAIDIR